MFKNMSFRVKIQLLVGCLLIIPVVIGVLGYRSLKESSKNYEHVAYTNLPNIKALDDMFLTFRLTRLQVGLLVLPGASREVIEEALKDIRGAAAVYEGFKAKYLNAEYAPGISFGPGEEELFNKVDAEWKEFLAAKEDALRVYESGDPDSRAKVVNILLNEMTTQANHYSQAVAKLRAWNDTQAEIWIEKAHKTAVNASSLSLIVNILGICAGMIVGAWFAYRVSNSIAHVAKDLSLGAEQVTEASGQIAHSAQSLSIAATEQASSLEETVATMEELTSMVKMNTENGKQAAALSAATRDIALKGEAEISGLIESIQSISADSKKIEEITNVIDDIAFQTNLLALNAAVEAARAGEQGKGFAVVAEAVRSLAQRSAAAAKDVADLIGRNVEKIEAGAAQAKRGGSVLAEIVNSVKKVADLNGEIAVASEEQTNGILQISQAMNQMDQVTQSNAAASEESAAASEQLGAQAVQLKLSAKELEKILGIKSVPQVGGVGDRKVSKALPHETSSPVIPFKKVAKASDSAKKQIPFAEDFDLSRKIRDTSGF